MMGWKSSLKFWLRIHEYLDRPRLARGPCHQIWTSASDFTFHHEISPLRGSFIIIITKVQKYIEKGKWIWKIHTQEEWSLADLRKPCRTCVLLALFVLREWYKKKQRHLMHYSTRKRREGLVPRQRGPGFDRLQVYRVPYCIAYSYIVVAMANADRYPSESKYRPRECRRWKTAQIESKCDAKSLSCCLTTIHNVYFKCF